MNKLTWETANQLIAENTEEISSKELNQNPLVSVSIVTYNHHQYIREALESVVCQKTDFTFEILIGDDGSSDGTTEIILEYQQKYPQLIKVFLTKENLGKYTGNGRFNFIRNLRNCRGKYIALLEGDDYWTSPDKLQKQVDFLESNPNFVISCHNVLNLYEDINNPNHYFHETELKTILTIEDLFRNNFIPTCSVVYRNNLFTDFPDWFLSTAMGDWPLHLLNSQYGKIKYFSESMGIYRIHSQSLWASKQFKDRLLVIIPIIKALEVFKEHFEHKYQEIIDETLFNFYQEVLIRYLNEYKNQEALEICEKIKKLSDYHYYLKILYVKAISQARLKKYLDAKESLETLLRYSPYKKAKILLSELKPHFPQNAEDFRIGKLLNLGCGNHFNPHWTNVDFTSTGEGVIAHNLRQGIPFPDRSFEVVYHSHVLEHFPKNEAEFFLKECYRVLESQGIIRVVIPDLEQIARLYLQTLENALQGSQEAANNYDWIMLEMYDQVVRNESGGEIKKYLAQNPLPNEQFIIDRLGVEGEQLIKMLRGKNFPNVTPNPSQIGYFREGGEIHQWMYDRFSLSRLLTKVGFVDIKICQANESQIPNFNSYYLDVLPDGRVRKSDSLFMEGIKP